MINYLKRSNRNLNQLIRYADQMKCGDIMRIYLDIDEDTKIIKDCKFKTFGCGAAIATSSMATDMVIGKTIYEAMEVTNKAVMEALDGLPPVKVHCSLLGIIARSIMLIFLVLKSLRKMFTMARKK